MVRSMVRVRMSWSAMKMLTRSPRRKTTALWWAWRRPSPIRVPSTPMDPVVLTMWRGQVQDGGGGEVWSAEGSEVVALLRGEPVQDLVGAVVVGDPVGVELGL